jgi:hypothetical protein
MGYKKARGSTIQLCVYGDRPSHLGFHFEGTLLEEFQRSKLSNMDLVDLIEMFADWLASSMRNSNGDVLKSIKLNKTRFSYDDVIESILRNTAIRFFGK